MLKILRVQNKNEIIKGISTSKNRIRYCNNTMRNRFDCKKENISKNKTYNQILNTQKNKFFCSNFYFRILGVIIFLMKLVKQLMSIISG